MVVGGFATNYHHSFICERPLSALTLIGPLAGLTPFLYGMGNSWLRHELPIPYVYLRATPGSRALEPKSVGERVCTACGCQILPYNRIDYNTNETKRKGSGTFHLMDRVSVPHKKRWPMQRMNPTLS